MSATPPKSGDIHAHIREVLACRKCPNMIGPVVTHHPLVANVAIWPDKRRVRARASSASPSPGRPAKRSSAGLKPLGWMKRPFAPSRLSARVCRCFPGKAKGGRRPGSRRPDEIKACAGWMEREIQIMRPELIIPVGRLAIEQFLPKAPLAELIGKPFRATIFGHACDVLALPHPSGRIDVVQNGAGHFAAGKSPETHRSASGVQAAAGRGESQALRQGTPRNRALSCLSESGTASRPWCGASCPIRSCSRWR